jgi:ABC-type dipeptide/oligopeptide/nickel transport system permease subunit
VAFLPVAVALLAGLPIGLIAGYRGGWADGIAMRTADSMLSFPTILLAIAIMGTLGPGTQNVVIALAFVYAPTFARLVRGSAMAAKTRDFVIAAKAVGATDLRITLRHILPEVVAPLTVQVTASFSTAIIAESTLSFLGLGTQPPTPSWGSMLNEARAYLATAPWFALIPAAAITVSVLSVNFLGDGLRDALDPRLRRR